MSYGYSEDEMWAALASGMAPTTPKDGVVVAVVLRLEDDDPRAARLMRPAVMATLWGPDEQ